MENYDAVGLIRRAEENLAKLWEFRNKRPDGMVPTDVGQLVTLETIACASLAMAIDLHQIATHGLRTYNVGR